MASKGDRPMSDAELHAALKRFEVDYKVDGPLTDDQRQVRLKRLQKYQKKEQEQEKKEARKREKEKNNTPKKAVVIVPQPAEVVEPETKKSRAGRRKSVAASAGNTMLQLTPSKDATLSQQNSSSSSTTTKLVRTETVTQSLANNKRPMTMLTSSSNTACIEISVTDVTLGEGAANLGLSLYGLDTTKAWKLLAERMTTVSGDCPGLITTDLFERGLYKLHLDTGAYFQAANIVPVFPCIEVVFEVVDTKKCYRLHVDLGPYSYTTSINN